MRYKGSICTTLAVADRNGASKMHFYFVRAFLENGYSVKVLYGSEYVGGSYMEELSSLGADVKKSKILVCPIPPLSYRLVLNSCKGSKALIGFHQRDRSTALKTADRLGVPGFAAIGNSHYFWGPVARIKEFYYRNSLKSLKIGKFIATSGKVRDELEDRFLIKADKIEVLENGIELLPDFDRAPKDDNSSLTFITVGRLDYQKGLDVMLNAWADSTALERGHTLQIVGAETPGNLSSASRKYIAELNQIVRARELDNSVRFLGQRNDVEELLGKADVYIHAARWEGFPLAVLEAMSAGLPVILTDIDSTPSGFIDGRSGYLVAPESKVDMATSIDKISIAGDNFRLEAGRHCREIVEKNYDINMIGRRFVEIVERLL